MKVALKYFISFSLFILLLMSQFSHAQDFNFQFGTNLRAIHLGGNFGLNPIGFLEHPPDFFNFLHKINVDWVGIQIGLHYDDSMDSTVERAYSGVETPTFEDEVLINTIRVLKDNGFNVYLTLAFHAFEAEVAEHPVRRWQLGDPHQADIDPSILPEFWPWALDHPLHGQFVNKFWETYTYQAVYYGHICEIEGVGLYSLGTETDRLFRTKSGGRWPNHFKEHLQSMVDSVRNVYNGTLTYDMHYAVLTAADFFRPGSDSLWEHLDLDVVGVSAYFPLLEAQPSSVTTVDSLEKSWRRIFDNYLIPLKNNNPERPIVFLEFGYVDAVAAPFKPNSNQWETKFFLDEDESGLDDGEETQANIIEAFFNINEQYENIVKGSFLWDNFMSSDQDWAVSFGKMRTMSIRQKLAEDVVRNYYKSHTSVNAQFNSIPKNFTLSQNFPNPFNSVTTINFHIPEYSHINITIFDILGKKIVTLVDHRIDAGIHNIYWDGRDSFGKIVSSGLYLYRIETKNYTEVKKALFLK